jgi:class 3 adenylate cyclase
MPSDSRTSPDPVLRDQAVRCANCLAENAPGARFCSHCGEQLIALCPACGGENDVNARICVRCSTGLPPRAGAHDPEIANSAAGRPSGDSGGDDQLERRPLAIMFCDLVGSTELSGRLDPEEYSEVLIAYREMCFSIVRRFGGFVARYVGDSVLVYFGYPQARDDDCAGAVYAAVNISSEMRSLSIQLAHHLKGPLLTHIGIHAGEVIAGELGQGESRERAAVIGVTPNIAARLEAAAGPGEIVISDAVYRQIHGLFECVDLGTLDLKGIAAPVHAYRVVSERNAFPYSPLDAGVRAGRGVGHAPQAMGTREGRVWSGRLD